MSALRFEDPDVQSGGPEQKGARLPAMSLAFENGNIGRDSYGLLDVQPETFSLSALLASEEFQVSLKNLHELYRLRASLGHWRRQLASFNTMLETRERQRTRKIEQTRAEMTAQNADQWRQRQQELERRIVQAEDREDTVFFLDAEQKALRARVRNMQQVLATMPADDERTGRYRKQVDRVQAFLDWTAADRYSANRWRARRQLRELNAVMDEFNRREARIEQLIAFDDNTQALADRVLAGEARLEEVSLALENTLSRARQGLVTQVGAELERQEQSVAYYLRESGHARARLSDALFRKSRGELDDSTDESQQPTPETGESR